MRLRSEQITNICNSSIVFWLVQALLIPGLLGSAWITFRTVNHRPRFPMLNDQPRVVRPQYDFSFVVSDEQLNSVLFQVRPRFEKHPPKINFVDHGLRLWGRSAQISRDSLSGNQLFGLLTDHSLYQQAFGSNSRPLLQMKREGIAVNTRETRMSVSHVDHLLGTLSEIGTPLSQQVKTARMQGSVGDILRYAVASFELNQREYEWTSMALALYARSGQNWYSADGQELNFDRIADRLMRQPQPQGVCYGQHRLYTLTIMLRVNDQMSQETDIRLLTDEKVDSINEYLLSMTRRFYQSQSTKGFWDGNWFDNSKSIP